MSRVGKNPITIPEGVSVEYVKNIIKVTGPKGNLEKSVLPEAVVDIKDNIIVVSRKKESKFSKSYHGTIRQIISNMIEGVVKGFEKKLKLFGIGYKAALKGKDLELSLGYSHPVVVKASDKITFSVTDPVSITVSGIDKEQVGLFAARIKSKRVPDAYKGKGVRYENEVIRLKEGKK